jgi:hypothetical protein
MMEVREEQRQASLLEGLKQLMLSKLAEIEEECPGTVSCADIRAAASGDATVLLGGPYWDVPHGRKDGKVSIDKDVDLVPMGRETSLPY